VCIIWLRLHLSDKTKRLQCDVASIRHNTYILHYLFVKLSSYRWTHDGILTSCNKSITTKLKNQHCTNTNIIWVVKKKKNLVIEPPQNLREVKEILKLIMKCRIWALITKWWSYSLILQQKLKGEIENY